MDRGSRTERPTGEGVLARLVAPLAPGDALTLDLSGSAAAHLSFVQFLVSASLAAERAGQSLTLTGSAPMLPLHAMAQESDIHAAVGAGSAVRRSPDGRRAASETHSRDAVNRVLTMGTTVARPARAGRDKPPVPDHPGAGSQRL